MEWTKTNLELHADRRFKLWDYSPSFQRILIRSPQHSQEGPNIDIVFWGTRHAEVVPYLGRISIVATESPMDTCVRFIIEGDEGSCVIDALSYMVFVDDGDIFDSILDHL